MGGAKASEGGEGPDGEGTGDYSIGTIVWVRRRNGSWWPGRILGINELSVSHLMSPRSGTPVKLLGREDASVDWYNMEKSKRVKAFRCGEFDDCILKAESCAGAPTKKREKYARREDAILHALELEKLQFERKKQSSALETVHIDENKHATVMKQSQNCVVDYDKNKSHHASDNCGDILDSELHLDAEQLNLSSQQTLPQFDAVQLSLQNLRHGSEMNWEDEGTEGTPRMRGLQDFGLRIAPTRKKPNLATVCEDVGKVIPSEGCVRNPSSIARCMGNGSPLNSSRGHSLGLKRKRSHVGHAEESSVKRRDRRRPLTQVLQSSAKLPVPCFSDFGCMAVDSAQQVLKERGVGTSQLKQIKKSSFSALPSNNSDYMGIFSKRESSLPASQDVFEIREKLAQPVSLLDDNACSNLLEQPSSNYGEKSGLQSVYGVGETALSDFNEVFLPVSRNFEDELVGGHLENPIQVEESFININGLDDAEFSNFLSKPESVEQIIASVADAGVSKWQLKGKRNARHLNKKNSENTNEKNLVEMDVTCSAPMHVVSSEDKLKVNKELGTKKVIGSNSAEPEESKIIEGQLTYSSVLDGCVRDDSNQSNIASCVDERQPRFGTLLLRKKAEVQDIQNQEKLEDQHILESKLDISRNEDSRAAFPSSWNSSRHENQWIGQIDRRQALWQKPAKGFHSETFPGVACKVPKSTDRMQFRQPDPFGISKFSQAAEGASIAAPLFDVDIDVQASYQGEHVPLLSLMSRLNGKAIIGYPITVETLEDGFSDILLAGNGYLNDSAMQSYDVDKVEGGALQPVWQTARRTAMQRTPRSCSLLENGDSISSQYLTNGNRQPLGKTVYPGLLSHKIRYIRKNLSHTRCPTLDKKLQKKFLKKVGLPSQKTRTLSSIAVEHKFRKESSESTHPLKLAQMPVVSCIPVKLIFSRIKEAVGSTSKPGKPMLSCSGSDEEKPM